MAKLVPTMWVIAVLTSVVPVTAESSRAYTSVLALGCYLPIPVHYRLNTREREYFAWYLIDDDGGGRIAIRDGASPDLDSYELIEETRKGHLMVLRLRFPSRNGREPMPGLYREVVALSDGKQHAMLLQEAKTHAEHMVAECLANPAPQLLLSEDPK